MGPNVPEVNVAVVVGSNRRDTINPQAALLGRLPMSIRPVKTIIQSKPTIEGAGVKLRRAFGFGDTAAFDPFLLLDDFRNDGFPKRFPETSRNRISFFAGLAGTSAL